jgi:hypothetical protein
MSETPEITGTFRNGHVELDSSVDWVEGERVGIVPLASLAAQPHANGYAIDLPWGIEESDYQDTREFRAKLMAQMDSFEPLELTPEEEAEWQASRQWIKDHTIAAVRKQMGL